MKHDGSHQLFPLLQVAIVLIVGIVVGNALSGKVPIEVWMATTVTTLLLCFLSAKKSLFQSLLILSTVFFLGCWLITKQLQAREISFPDKAESYEAVVVSTPTMKGKVVRCDLLVSSGRMMGRKLRATFLRRELEQRHLALQVGVGIVASSVLEQPRNYYSDSNFNYVRWMSVQGYAANTFIAPQQWHSKAVDLTSLSHLQRAAIAAMKLRAQLLDKYKMARYDEQSYGVIAAMTLGDKSALTSDLKEVYSITGAAHVLALSGLHLGVIYAILSLLFAHRRWRLFGQVVIIVTMWSYVLMVGMSPSVLRSATMFSIYAVVSLLGRERMSINTLALTAILMLCSNPLCLWDVGAQMSFLAVLGILLFFKPLYFLLDAELLMSHRLLKSAWSLFSVSIASQLGVAPLVMFYFGRFSCYFLLTNLVAVPLSTLIIYSAVLMFFSTGLPTLCTVFSYILLLLARLLNASLSFIAALPYSSIDGIRLQTVSVIAMYAITLCLYAALKIMQRPNRKKPYTLKYSSN